MPIKILLNGAEGRMGKTISAIAYEHDAVIQSAVDIGGNPESSITECDVVIDFSFHEVTLSMVELAASKKIPIVIGTTGQSDSDREKIISLTNKIPIVWAGNFSVGINLLNYLTQKAAKILSKEYNPEIIEMHHKHKKDAPSGTAVKLVDIIRQARNLSQENICYGRSGITGERNDDEIGVHAIRGSDIVGEHNVIFSGEGERIELVHKATDRKIFAQGAIRAAHWVIGQTPGLYDMDDVLGLKD